MSRLTEKGYLRYCCNKGYEECEQQTKNPLDEDCCCDCDVLQQMIDKLGEYEDLEEQGLLHKTNIAIGQTVYTNFSIRGWYLREAYKPYKAKVVFIGLNGSKEMGGGMFNVMLEKNKNMLQYSFSDIGKSIFLTKQEAEAELQAMQEGGNDE